MGAWRWSPSGRPLWRSVWITLLFLGLWAGYQIWAVYAGAAKLAAVDYDKGGSAHLSVTLAFRPEAFHVALLQKAGRLIEVDGRTAYLMDVSEPAAVDLARRYWVETIEPWQGL